MVFLPYCLARQDDGSYVVCNRRYKPVGITRTDWVDYNEYPVRVRFKRTLSDAQIAKLDAKGRIDPACIYLYTDACVPTASAQAWADYSDRLQRLARYVITQ